MGAELFPFDELGERSAISGGSAISGAQQPHISAKMIKAMVQRM